jgi:hypothetical protein
VLPQVSVTYDCVLLGASPALHPDADLRSIVRLCQSLSTSGAGPQRVA